jgi:hypothetical protein
MDQHRNPKEPGTSSQSDRRPQDGGLQTGDRSGSDQPSAPERRHGEEEGATRDFQERVRDLDRAGTIQEPHDRRAAGGTTPEPTGNGDERASGRLGSLRGHAWTLGLAASSLALLAGTRGGAAGGGGAPGLKLRLDVALANGFMPPEQVTRADGCQWDLHVSEHDRIDFFVEFLMGRNYDRTRSGSSASASTAR